MDKKQYKQSFFYRGREYKYKIQASSIRIFEIETGLEAETTVVTSYEGRYKLLYYCTCWNGEYVSLEEFMNDVKAGRASFRPGAREYWGVSMSKLFVKKIREFKNKGEL